MDKNAFPGIDSIRRYSVARPGGWTIFGNAEQFDSLPQETKDQVVFLNADASRFVSDYFEIARLMTGGGWDPFAGGNFKSVDRFNGFYHGEESRQLLKKWLYHRGLPFSAWVFILQNSHEVIMTTWKMVIRYSAYIFYGDDVAVFDRTLNWCLFYYHDDVMFFGKDRVVDTAEDERMMMELNERKRKYPQFRHPFL